MAANCAGAFLDLLGKFGLALLAQGPNIGGKDLQGRLEAVRQISGARARARQGLFLCGEQAVYFVSEWLDFARRGHIKPSFPLRNHVPDGDPQALQWRQADGDLDEECAHQSEGEHHERRREITDIFAHRDLDIAMILRNDSTKRPPVGVGDRAQNGNGELAAWPLEFFLPQFAIRCLLGQGKRGIPQGARSNEAVGCKVFHLPVVPG